MNSNCSPLRIGKSLQQSVRGLIKLFPDGKLKIQSSEHGTTVEITAMQTPKRKLIDTKILLIGTDTIDLFKMLTRTHCTEVYTHTPTQVAAYLADNQSHKLFSDPPEELSMQLRFDLAIVFANDFPQFSNVMEVTTAFKKQSVFKGAKWVVLTPKQKSF